jgi:D-alanyl-D-alanine carboxypeptidase
MPSAPRHLLNSESIELWPAHLLRARGNHDARILAQADWLLRRKRDGRYLGARLPSGLMPLVTRFWREPGVDAALGALAEHEAQPQRQPAAQPLRGLQERLAQLGLDADDYGARTGLALVAEPSRLALAGRDRYGRALWLTTAAGRQWQRMRAAAAVDGVAMDAISGYRSHDYQLGIFERKFARGQTLAQVLEVNAAPGYSEHHGGEALDIGAPGEPPAEEAFERTPAFAWLRQHAGRFGFQMSYPRDNPHGIVYEPWHWRYQAP